VAAGTMGSRRAIDSELYALRDLPCYAGVVASVRRFMKIDQNMERPLGSELSDRLEACGVVYMKKYDPVTLRKHGG
jgi:hypothetical protein